MSDSFIQEKEIDFNKLWEAILRRKRIIIFSTSLILTSSLIYSSIKRIISPVYSGSFVFLVNDPLESTRQDQNVVIGEALQSVEYFGSFFGNQTSQDIPTLIDFLTSPSFLRPFAEKYNLDTLKLIKNLTLNQKYIGFKQTFKQTSKGSIIVKYDSNSPEKVLDVLENLKEY